MNDKQIISLSALDPVVTSNIVKPTEETIRNKNYIG